jgi:Fe-S-cluster containining protein
MMICNYLKLRNLKRTGLAEVREIVFRSVPMMIEKLKLKITTKSQIDNVHPDTKHNRITKIRR